MNETGSPQPPDLTVAPEARSSGDAQVLSLATLLQLEKELRHAATLPVLGFVLANETLRLVRFKQAVVWRRGRTGQILVEAVSGVDRPDAGAPYALYCKSLIRRRFRQANHREVQTLSPADFPDSFHASWQEWRLGVLLWLPLITPSGEMAGGCLFFRETLWTQGEQVLLERLADAGAHALWALERKKGRLSQRLGTGWVRLGLLALSALVLALPVRLSVLAPVQIAARSPQVVSAPVDGVIREIHVTPSQAVQKGTLLFSLDDTRIRNEQQVAEKALAVVRAELDRARQKAFMDDKSKADLRLLQARVEQKIVEKDYATELLEKSRILADRDGIAVFSDPGDWAGRPVKVGEKVMTLADPLAVEARIDLPVEDAITLAPGAEVLIFLNVRPDRPYQAVLSRSGYEAQVTAQGILAFSLTADLSGSEDPLPRIGLRGTAKIFGRKVRLFYYLMRKPLAFARQFLGW